MSEYDHTVISNLNQVTNRIKELLTRFPQYRNMDDMDFWLAYCDHYLGFRVGSALTFEMKERIKQYANPQTVSRMLRKLRESESSQIKERVKMLVELRDTNLEEYDAQVLTLKRDLHSFKWIPYDITVLIHKYIKEETFREMMLDA